MRVETHLLTFCTHLLTLSLCEVPCLCACGRPFLTFPKISSPRANPSGSQLLLWARRPCKAAVGDHGLKPGQARTPACACRIQEGNDRGARLKCLRLETVSRATSSTAT